MSLGLGILRLDPRAFWAMTLPEFAAAARAVTGPLIAPAVPDRSDLTRLMSLFPD
jgi:uncharacterized phage protein (TIGR02216 family)